MIINGEVKYNFDEKKDHKEWYISLGLDGNLFDSVIRGFVIDNKIIYYKGSNFMYDQEVIQAAKRYTPYIRYSLQKPNLEACCGIVFSNPTEWEPIMKLQENEITGIPVENSLPKKEIKEPGTIVELKNNYQDPKFIKTALILTIIILIISIITKIILIQNQTLHLNHFMDIVLMIGQVTLLGITIYGYWKKRIFPKYTGLVAGASLILTFYWLDALLGIFYLLFCIDQNIYLSVIQFIKNKIGRK